MDKMKGRTRSKCIDRTAYRDGGFTIMSSSPSSSFLLLTFILLLRRPNPGASYMMPSAFHRRARSLIPQTVNHRCPRRSRYHHHHPWMKSSTQSSIGNPSKTTLCASSWSRLAQEQESIILDETNSSRRQQNDEKQPLAEVEIVDTCQRKVASTTCSDEIAVATLQTPANLASPRAFLESLPDGAYTVLRCDVSLTHGGGHDAGIIRDELSASASAKPPPSSCHIWGLDFHLQRLQQSYEGAGFFTLSMNDADMERHVQTAAASTRRILNTLLQQAVLELPRVVLGRDTNEGVHENMNHDSSKASVVVMVTILWHPSIVQEDKESSLFTSSNSSSSRMIQVRGHILYSGTSTATITTSAGLFNYSPDPITAVLATTLENSNKYSHQRLANRKYNHPGCKLSSWCQKRRPLEEMFMQKQIALGSKDNTVETVVDAGEVLLVDRLDDDENECVQIELLEGLTSNLFVVLNGGKVLCTPPAASAPPLSGTAGYVLPGYARQRILDCARNLGMHVQVAPILVSIPNSQKDNGQVVFEQPPWEEVFCTSSVKLITPVERILLPSSIYNNDTEGGNANVGPTALNLQQVWCSRTLKEEQTNETTIQTPVWKLLYNGLLRHELGHLEDED